jgi:hypothetical protein
MKLSEAIAAPLLGIKQKEKHRRRVRAQMERSLRRRAEKEMGAPWEALLSSYTPSWSLPQDVAEGIAVLLLEPVFLQEPLGTRRVPEEFRVPARVLFER